MVNEHPKNLRISNFFYLLPEERIAHFPMPDRDQSRLLIYRHQEIAEDVYASLPVQLPTGCRLVFNNTRVIQARLMFQKPTGAFIEIFLLEPEDASEGLELAVNARGRSTWKCLIGGAGKWKAGQIVTMERHFGGKTIRLSAAIVEKQTKNFVVEFTWEPTDLSFSEMLHHTGNIPIPPYLKRAPETQDLERYQTVYAAKEGSVAAPTAGLHFTEELMQNLKSADISVSYLTLHVGAGTFLPVKAELMEGHAMHGEFLDIEKQTITQLITSAGNTFAVGTTSLRTLESLYWMGVKALMNPELTPAEIPIKQWEIYEELAATNIDPVTAYKSLISWMEKNEMERLLTKTEILIAPPYKPKTIKGLITNFHQPNSTLLLLVAAVIGEDWRKVYDYALENEFRFLSYGDGCLLYTS